ncbi:MAG: hypothetical protein M1839_002536 [Geoglossum umbratile]|nr:MAG: hypothetical protein M1839_002536 [Geoglossum umbratile]
MVSIDQHVGQPDPLGMREATGYMQIENYGIIGNMHTPDFDSPSVFCRLLDKDKGGHFSICQPRGVHSTTKQQYLPSNNILQTWYICEIGVVNLVDFFPRPKAIKQPMARDARRRPSGAKEDLKKWLVRRVECVRGSVDLDLELFPAFNYAQDPHETEVCQCGPDNSKAIVFRSKGLELQLDVTIDYDDQDGAACPVIKFERRKSEKGLSEGVISKFHLEEGQSVSFILRENPTGKDEILTQALIDNIQDETGSYWYNWISKCKYKGRYLEVVTRSLMVLKLLTYEPTGAIIAAPTFSLPEDFGGTRNWDYRYSWVRDSSFTLYILLRMGFTDEAEAYMNFISDRFRYSRTEDGALPIMFSIRGETKLDEIELTHLDGYRGSKPVRIGNGAASHLQLDIYGELMDAIYLYNKYGKPVSWDQWVAIREIVDYVCRVWKGPDMSIWEVRSKKQNFVYSKMLLWVAVDRALRLSEKRCFPCPHREQWMKTRDEIYEEVMEKGYNTELNCFIQSYESNDILDSAVLIESVTAPLVFFIAPNDPRFLSTVDQILKPPDKGGLTSAGLVFRYNHLRSEDGVGGREGSFSMCTFWLVEALTRAGSYDKNYLVKAINIFGNMLNFSNHLGIFSEEIARSGEQLGNTPQAFSHLALISAALNLDRTM